MSDTRKSYFYSPSELKLDATNLEAEWKFRYQKFELFMQAIAINEKPEATQLAMFLAAIGDDALKVYNTFEYSSAVECKKLTVVVNKFKSYCTPQKNCFRTVSILEADSGIDQNH